MPPTVYPGFYIIEFVAQGVIIPPPQPLLLTNNGEGKQLTVQPQSGQYNQVWEIKLPSDEDEDSEDRIIVLPRNKDALAVSQDVIQHPDQVSLVKNLQVWTFGRFLESTSIYQLRSNLYRHWTGSNPVLGVEQEGGEVRKVVIEYVPVLPDAPPGPHWKLIPVKMD